MRSSILLVLFLFGSAINLLGQVPFVCNGDYYLSSTSGNGVTQIYKVEIGSTGQATFEALANDVGSVVVNAIGYRSADNFIYSLRTTNTDLYRIDATGQGTNITSLNLPSSHNFYGADFTADGKFMVAIGSTFLQGSNLLSFVDFETPGYPVNSIPISNSINTEITDIAFNPITNLLHGYDSTSDRMVVIDPATGELDNSFPNNQIAPRIGAVFFDSFGDLFGYGGPGGSVLYKIDPETGIVEVMADGPFSTNKDGCSCPYTVRLNKLVEPLETTPCSEVTYHFAIANISSDIQTGVTLEDQLPPDLLITAIEDNPFGGNVISGVNTDLLSIADMVIPPGFDTLSIRVEVSDDAAGIYKNQATLQYVPLLFDETMFSDNPLTIETQDSTILEVFPLNQPTSVSEFGICFSESISLQSGEVATDYLWSTGETTQSINVDQAGFYWVDVSNDCQTIRDSFRLDVSDSFVVVTSNDITIDLGDEVFVSANHTSNNPVALTWTESGLNSYLDCTDCANQRIRPFRNTTLYVEARDSNDCVAMDSMFIQVVPNYNIYVPNIFSPNQDGHNDLFMIYGAGISKINVFRIYDRWGALLHEANDGQVNDPGHGWDGIYRGEALNDAVFVWYAEVEFLDGETTLLKGDITLIR